MSYREQIESAKQEAHAFMLEQDLAASAKVLFDVHESIVKSIREAKDSDGPSLKKSSEEFEASEETQDLVSNVLREVKELVFGAITEDPESSVLFYELLGDYAKGTVKSYRDFVLITNAQTEDDDEQQVVVDISKEDLEDLRTRIESFDNLAGGTAVPRKEKSGTIAFSSLARLFDNEDTASVDASVTTYDTLFYVDGELVDTQILAEVALYHLSSATNHVTTKDIRDVVAKTRADGKAILSENYTVTVNGHTLEMVRNES